MDGITKPEPISREETQEVVNYFFTHIGSYKNYVLKSEPFIVTMNNKKYIVMSIQNRFTCCGHVFRI
jgi:hypothetical protein